jgi:hypothetical protein
VTVGNKTFGLEDIAGLKAVVADLKAKHQKKAEQLAVFDGIDVAEAKSAIAKLKELGNIDNLDDKVKERVQAIEEQIESKYRKQVQSLQGEVTKVTGERDKALESHGRSFLESEARKAFTHHKVSPDWQDVMLEKVRAVTKVKPSNESFTIEVLDMAGNPRISNAQGSTESMSVLELVGEWKTSQSLARCYEGTNASGSGASGSSVTHQTGGRFVLSKQDAKDANKYRAAQEAARKAGQSLSISD